MGATGSPPNGFGSLNRVNGRSGPVSQNVAAPMEAMHRQANGTSLNQFKDLPVSNDSNLRAAILNQAQGLSPPFNTALDQLPDVQRLQLLAGLQERSRGHAPGATTGAPNLASLNTTIVTGGANGVEAHQIHQNQLNLLSLLNQVQQR